MSNQTIKITQEDNFVWRLLKYQQAKAILKANILPVYALDDDGTESLLISIDDLVLAFNEGRDLAIEVGFINPVEVSH